MYVKLVTYRKLGQRTYILLHCSFRFLTTKLRAVKGTRCTSDCKHLLQNTLCYPNFIVMAMNHEVQ